MDLKPYNLLVLLVAFAALAECNSRVKRQGGDCSINNGGCAQECKPRPRGGVRCRCTKGYHIGPDQKSCVDIDECAAGTHSCQPGQTCSNTVASYMCSFPGQEGSCSVNNGGCEHRCRQNQRGLKCVCKRGFELQSNGKSCLDTDECSTGVHNCPELCVNKPGSFLCVSQQEDADCNFNNGGCDHRCRDTNKGPRCICRRGFALQPDKKSCLEATELIVDPCEINNGGCDQICINNNGAAECDCELGYLLIGGICERLMQIGFPTSAPQPTTLPPPIQQKSCGVNTKKSLIRIVGGRPADPKDWPWMAAILRTRGNSQFCGGTLITVQHVLSAAHCFTLVTTKDVKVRLGEYDFAKADENNPTDFDVVEIKSHEGYNRETQENDVAVLKLSRPSSFSEYIWPVCLPPPDNDFKYFRGYVIGWGTIHFGGPVSQVLQEVVIPVWNQTDCVAAYPQNKVADTMMCAGNKLGGMDSCQGDSGGPFLVQILPDSRWYVAGVVSWGIECASPDKPGVYTRVNKYLDWIKANTL